MNIKKELDDIKHLIQSACVMEAVKREVGSMFKHGEVMVIGGKYAGRHVKNAENYDIVVVHHDDQEKSFLVARRLRDKIKGLEIQAVDGIVDNVIGIKTSRRVKK
jgi:hypothetical protein